MKLRNLVLVAVVALIVAFLGYEFSWAEPESNSNISVATVNIRAVFQNSKANEEYKTKAMKEQKEILAEMEEMKEELQSQQEGLKTFKPGSDAYDKAKQELMMTQAKLEAKQKFYEQKFSSKDKDFTEGLYKDVLEVIAEVAENQGYDLVLEQDQPELPSPNAQELMLSIRTDKVLYSGGLDDITDEVIAEMNNQ